MDASGPVTEEGEVKEEEQLMGVAGVREPAEYPELCAQVVEASGMVLQSMCRIPSFHNVDDRLLLK